MSEVENLILERETAMRALTGAWDEMAAALGAWAQFKADAVPLPEIARALEKYEVVNHEYNPKGARVVELENKIATTRNEMRYEAGVAAEQALAMLNAWRVTKSTGASESAVTQALRKVADRIRQFLPPPDQEKLDVVVDCLDVPLVSAFIERALSVALHWTLRPLMKLVKK